MRIVFMGTPAFATQSLDALIEAGEEIIAVVTAPDKGSGRGRKINQSDVKRYALEHNLNILQPTNLKSQEFLNQLRALKPDVIVVVAFRMLPREVWKLPAYGTINLHASLLPQYRGAAPINWAIINGEKVTGVTTFFINEDIDTGDLIMKESVPIDDNDTAGSLHDKLMLKGASLMVQTIKAIALGEAPAVPQTDDKHLQTAPKIFKEDTRINWHQDAGRVYDFIRGLSPYPAATCSIIQNDGNIDLKIYNSRLGEDYDKGTPGMLRVKDRKQLFVACNDRWIEITEIQPSGKRRMAVSDFLNGTTLSQNAKMA